VSVVKSWANVQFSRGFQFTVSTHGLSFFSISSIGLRTSRVQTLPSSRRISRTCIFQWRRTRRLYKKDNQIKKFSV